MKSLNPDFWNCIVPNGNPKENVTSIIAHTLTSPKLMKFWTEMDYYYQKTFISLLYLYSILYVSKFYQNVRIKISIYLKLKLRIMFLLLKLYLIILMHYFNENFMIRKCSNNS